MLLHPCPRTVDEPIRVLGLDGEDWIVVVGPILFVYLAWSLLPAAIMGAGAFGMVRLLKRGKPRGALMHALWALGMPLPGWPPAPPADGRTYSPWP